MRNNTIWLWIFCYQEAPKKAEIYATTREVIKDGGGASHSTIDPSPASESHQSDEWGFGFDFNSSSLGEGGHISEPYLNTKNNQDETNKSNASSTNINIDSDVNLFESKDAVTKIRIQNEVLLLNQFDII